RDPTGDPENHVRRMFAKDFKSDRISIFRCRHNLALVGCNAQRIAEISISWVVTIVFHPLRLHEIAPLAGKIPTGVVLGLFEADVALDASTSGQSVHPRSRARFVITSKGILPRSN